MMRTWTEGRGKGRAYANARIARRSTSCTSGYVCERGRWKKRETHRKEKKIIRDGGNRVHRFAKVCILLRGEESRSRTNFFASLWSQAAKTRELTEPRISAVKQAPPCFTDWTPYGHSPSKQLKRKFTFAKVKYLNLIFSCLSDTYLPDTTTVWCKKIYTRRSTVCFYAPFCILLKYLYFQGN